MTTKSTKTPVKPLVSLLYFVCLGLLLALGGWQLSRGLEKAELEKKIASQGGDVTVIPPVLTDWQKLNYQEVEITGNWHLSHDFLLDNRIHHGVSGYEVISPFVISDSDKMILVNRGWIPKNQVSSVMADNGQHINKKIGLSGQLYFPSVGFTLGPAYTDTTQRQVVIQYLDLEAIMSLLKGKLVTPVLVMNPDDGVFTRIWKPYIVNAYRHYGYAVQWWGLAIVFIVFGLIWRRSTK